MFLFSSLLCTVIYKCMLQEYTQASVYNILGVHPSIQGEGFGFERLVKICKIGNRRRKTHHRKEKLKARATQRERKTRNGLDEVTDGHMLRIVIFCLKIASLF